MKDLASIAAKYDTRRKYGCKVCDLSVKNLEIVRGLRWTHGMSFRGLSNAAQRALKLSIAETTFQKHFSRHEAA